MQRILSFDQAPPLTAVARFFLSAPLFALAAAVLLLWVGEPALQSRWSPSTLALTHLFTLGFMAMAMIGALFHILPVVAGTTLPQTQRTARVVHALLSAGTAALAAGFWFAQPRLFQLALPLLVAAFLWLLCTCTVGLWQPHAPGAAATVAAVRLALAALAVTVTLGALLAAGFAWPAATALPPGLLTDIHALWGLFGWAGLLVIGVAFQVVPMFQVTPLYPQRLTRVLALTLFLLLVLWSISAAVSRGQPQLLRSMVSATLLCAYATFALATLRLLARRKRASDATTLFWRLAMASLLGCAALWLMPAQRMGGAQPLALGLLFIVGFVVSSINGMLYKIVPFLVWYHLQATAAGAAHAVPGVRLILPDAPAKRQFWVHCCALAMLLAATLYPAAMTRPAACALCASSFWLFLNVRRALRVYWRIGAIAPVPPRQAQASASLAACSGVKPS
jgi:hypothetical protein